MMVMRTMRGVLTSRRAWLFAAFAAALAVAAVFTVRGVVARERPSPLPFVTADLDGDGAGELLIATADRREVELYRRDAAGRFALAHTYAVTERVDDILVTDLDADGANDLVLVDSVAGDLVLLAGDGRGGFQALRRRPIPMRPQEAVALDLDRDGRRDLLVRNATGLTYLRAGLGGEFGTLEPLTVPGVPASLACFDADGDGQVDAVVALDGGGIVVLPSLSRPRPDVAGTGRARGSGLHLR